jgi:O-antigen ligase
MTERIARWWSSTPPMFTSIIGIAMFGLAPLLGWALAYALAYDERRKWLAFGALVMVALVPAVVRWPVVSTFGLFAFLATSFDAAGPLLPGASLSKPFGVLAGAVLLGAGLVERRLGRPPTAALWWGAFMLWVTLTAMWAMNLEQVLQVLPNAVSLVVLYFAAVCFRPSRRELYCVCALTVLGGVLASALAYFFGLDEMATGTAARGRLVLNDADSNPNTLGRILILPLALAIAGFVGGRGMIQRALAVGCGAFIGLGIFVSMSRGAVVAMIATLLVFLYRVRALWHIVPIVALLVVVSTLAPARFYERIDAVISGQDDTGAGRTEIWRKGLQGFERFGVLGAGLNNFSRVHQDGRAAHNIFLMTLIESGVPGLAMMLAAIASGLLAVRRARSAGHRSVILSALEAACIGTLMSGMFADTLWRKSFWLAWILLAWAMYSEKRADDNADDLVPSR